MDVEWDISIQVACRHSLNTCRNVRTHKQTDNIDTYENEVNIEVLAALHVFKTPQSQKLYDAIQQQHCQYALPSVLASLVLEYLSSQPNAGGEHDSAHSLLR